MYLYGDDLYIQTYKRFFVFTVLDDLLEEKEFYFNEHDSFIYRDDLLFFLESSRDKNSYLASLDIYSLDKQKSLQTLNLGCYNFTTKFYQHQYFEPLKYYNPYELAISKILFSNNTFSIKELFRTKKGHDDLIYFKRDTLFIVSHNDYEYISSKAPEIKIKSTAMSDPSRNNEKSSL